MPLNDIIAVAGSKHATFVCFERGDMEFEMDHTFNDTHTGYISDAVFSGDNFFSCCAEDSYVYQLRMRNFQSVKKDMKKEEQEMRLKEQKKREALFSVL